MSNSNTALWSEKLLQWIKLRLNKVFKSSFKESKAVIVWWLVPYVVAVVTQVWILVTAADSFFC